MLDTDLGSRRDLEFVITARGQLQPRAVLMLMVSSTTHSLDMILLQDFTAQDSPKGICSLACSTQFPLELRSATKSSGMKQVQLERERREFQEPQEDTQYKDNPLSLWTLKGNLNRNGTPGVTQ